MFMNPPLLPVLATSVALLLTTPGTPMAKAGEGAAAAAEASSAPVAGGDVIARVGDQSITFGEINTVLNSSAIVGVSVPALGTPDRDTARITLLDKFISANLIYLDAIKQGLDKDPAYRREIERFDDAILAGLYRQHILAGDVAVSDEEIQAYYTKNIPHGIDADADIRADIRASIEATLRREKIKQRLAEARNHLHDGVEVVVHEENLALAGDAERADTVVLAEIDGESVTWGDVKDKIIAVGKGAVKVDPTANEEDARRTALQTQIDLRIMANKARAAGLDQSPVYLARVKEFHKSRLTNLHREQLIEQMTPSEEELKAFYEANKGSIVQPEARKIQMVVLKTKDEADQVRAKIESGEITMYQAAQQYSTAAKAKEDLGEVGWVYQGDTAPALDAVIFSLGPSELSEPVETPAGWHLVTVQDVQEAKFSAFNDATTHKLTKRKYLDEKLNDYAVNLRQNVFPVEVYQDVLIRLAQQEADMVKDLAEKAKEPGSITERRVEELQKLMKP